MKRAHAAAYARGALVTRPVRPLPVRPVALDSVRWTKAVSADAAVAASPLEPCKKRTGRTRTRRSARPGRPAAFRRCGGRLASSSPVQVKEDEDERRSNSPARLPEVQSGNSARARQESGRPLEVDVGLVGDGDVEFSSDRHEDLARAVDVVVAAAALHARLANPTLPTAAGAGRRSQRWGIEMRRGAKALDLGLDWMQTTLLSHRRRGLRGRRRWNR